MKIVICGLGLIGGSAAKSLKMNTSHEIYGYDISDDVMLDAYSGGHITAKATKKDFYTADLLYLCMYPPQAVSFMETHGPHLKKGCIVTDACGIKSAFCERMAELSQDGEYIFVGGHPMAGKEQFGFKASDPSIFIGASYIITPCGAPQEAVDTVKDLAESMGFSNIVITTPQEHDRMIAFTSQLPHVIACAYVKSPQCLKHKGFSAGSYRDVSRVADINAGLWSDLFLENREELVNELDIFIRNITGIRDMIDEKNENIEKSLQEAADIKRRDR